MSKHILVTEPYLPNLLKLCHKLFPVWRAKHLTNNGQLVEELEQSLQKKFGVTQGVLVSNATIGLQLAIKALELSGEIITTPFSFAASVNAIIWEGCTPVFADINKDTLTIDPKNIEAAITPRTSAILAVHVYGFPCEVEKIEKIAKKHKLKVIYDAAHACNVQYKNHSILNYGDISVLSLHATKLFHTAEGGFIVTKSKKLASRVRSLANFGKEQNTFTSAGINAKMSELHAAIGLCLLPYLDTLIAKRKSVISMYKKYLYKTKFQFLKPDDQAIWNYAYFPILFTNEQTLKKTIRNLHKAGIYPRRYFYPSLNTLSYTPNQPCPVAEDIAKRILCLPLHTNMSKRQIRRIAKIFNQSNKSTANHTLSIFNFFPAIARQALNLTH